MRNDDPEYVDHLESELADAEKEIKWLEIKLNMANEALAALAAPQPPVPCPDARDFVSRDDYGRLQAKVAEQSAEIERITAENRSMNEDICHYLENEQANLSTIAQQAAEIEKVALAYEEQIVLHNKTLDELKYTGLAAAAEAKRGDELQARVAEQAEDIAIFMKADCAQAERIAELEKQPTMVAIRDLLASKCADNDRRLRQEIKEQAALIERCDKGLAAVESLIDESTGVTGLHLNGDIALWTELREGGSNEGWLVEFDQALTAIAAHKRPPSPPDLRDAYEQITDFSKGTYRGT